MTPAAAAAKDAMGPIPQDATGAVDWDAAVDRLERLFKNRLESR